MSRLAVILILFLSFLSCEGVQTNLPGYDDTLVPTYDVVDCLGLKDWTDELVYFNPKLQLNSHGGYYFQDQHGKIYPAQVVGDKIATILTLKKFEKLTLNLHQLSGSEDVELETDLVLDSQSRTVSNSFVTIRYNEGDKVFKMNGNTFGVLNLHRDFEVLSTNCEIQTGPVISEAVMTFNLSHDVTYILRVNLPAYSPVILVREEIYPLYDDNNLVPKLEKCHMELTPLQGATRVFSQRVIEIIKDEPINEHTAKRIVPYESRSLKDCHWMCFYNDDSAIGVFPRFLSKWHRSKKKKPTPLIEVDEETLIFPLNQSTREWALVVGDKSLITMNDRDYQLRQIAAKWGQTPLDKIRKWSLDWGNHEYKSKGRYKTPPCKRGDWPYFVQEILLRGYCSKQSYIHILQTWVSNIKYWEKNKSKYDDRRYAASYMPWRAAEAFMLYLHLDEDYWPRSSWKGPSNLNMKVLGDAGVAIGQAYVTDHPEKDRFIDWAHEWICKDMNKAKGDNIKVWPEGPGGYAEPALGALIHAASKMAARRSSDLETIFHIVSALARYQLAILTPPDSRWEDNRHLPFMGDCNAKKWDKRTLMKHWGEYFVPLINGHDPELADMLVRAFQRKDPEAHYGSLEIPYFGYVMRYGDVTAIVNTDSFVFGHNHNGELSGPEIWWDDTPLMVALGGDVGRRKNHNCLSAKSLKFQGNTLDFRETEQSIYAKSHVWGKNRAEWIRQFILVKKENPFIIIFDTYNLDEESQLNWWRNTGTAEILLGQEIQGSPEEFEIYEHTYYSIPVLSENNRYLTVIYSHNIEHEKLNDTHWKITISSEDTISSIENDVLSLVD